MQSKRCLNIWTKTWHPSTLAVKAPNSFHLVWANEYLPISVSVCFLMFEISPLSVPPPLPKTRHLCPLCLECFGSSWVHSIPQSNPTFPTSLSGAWPCAKVLPQVLTHAWTPSPGFFHMTFNRVLGQKSGTQGCLFSGSLLRGGTDLVPLCICSENLQHLAQRVDGAFHASPARLPCCQGGSVCSTPIAGRAWATSPWRRKGAAFWPPASSSVRRITPEPRYETGPTLTVSLSLLEKRGKEVLDSTNQLFCFVLFWPSNWKYQLFPQSQALCQTLAPHE